MCGRVAYVFLASVIWDFAVARGGFLPEHVDLGSYLRIWSTVDLGGGLVNSLLVAGTVAAVCALVSVGRGYVLVRFGFRGRVSILRGLLALQSIPGTLLLLPVFVLFASAATLLGIPVIGTRWALFLTYLTFALPFSTWVMVTYLRGLPRELDEAARIDGASSWRVLTRIILPPSPPGVGGAGIFAVPPGWNDVLFASVLTNPHTPTAAVRAPGFGATPEGGGLPVY